MIPNSAMSGFSSLFFERRLFHLSKRERSFVIENDLIYLLLNVKLVV
jgi:hypothetical protein